MDINFDPFISLPSGGGDNDQGWSEPDDSFPEDFDDAPEPDNIEYSEADNNGDASENGGYSTNGEYTRSALSASFGLGLGSGLYGEASRGLTTTVSTVTREIQAVNVIGKIATAAKWAGYLGNTISLAANTVNLYNQPNAANYARLAVNGIAVGLNLVNFVAPGLGTGLSILVSTIDTAGGFDWLYDSLGSD